MNLQQLKQHDWVITIIASLLLIIGLILIYSTTINSVTAAQGEGTLLKQLIFVVVGISIYFLLSMVQFPWFKTQSLLIIAYATTIILLLYVQFFGETISGANRWISLGFFSFQPSEYAKLVLILITGAIFTLAPDLPQAQKKRSFNLPFKQLRKFQPQLEKLLEQFPFLQKLVLSSVLTFPIVFLTFIQPSLGNAVIIFVIWALLIFVIFPEQIKLFSFALQVIAWILLVFQFLKVNRIDDQLNIIFIDTSNLNLFYIFALLLLEGALILFSKFKTHFILISFVTALILFFGFIFSWNNLLSSYQKTRIDTYIKGPESAAELGGYQVIQSRIAVGSGRLYGRGFLEGTQSSLHVLTQAHTDFVFAALSEQFGFIGAVLLMILYLILLVRIIKIGQNANSEFGTIVCIGIACLILLHIFINIGMNLGELPVTGIPLPLVSYGGSSVLLILISLGIVQSVGGSQRSVDIADNLMLTSRSLMH